MKSDKKKDLVSTSLNYFNALLKCYTERYQDIPLKVFFGMDLDKFWEEMPGLVHPDFPKKDPFKKLKYHLVQFQEQRVLLNQNHVPYQLKYIYLKEFYWSVSGFLFSDDYDVTKRLLFTELLYRRHQLFSLEEGAKDLTLYNGSTHFALAVHGFYEKHGNNFGMNDNFFRPDEMREVSKILDILINDGFKEKKIKDIDKVIEEEFGLYEVLLSLFSG